MDLCSITFLIYEFFFSNYPSIQYSLPHCRQPSKSLEDLKLAVKDLRSEFSSAKDSLSGLSDRLNVIESDLKRGHTHPEFVTTAAMSEKIYTEVQFSFFFFLYMITIFISYVISLQMERVEKALKEYISERLKNVPTEESLQV
jgi:hypothetical protein